VAAARAWGSKDGSCQGLWEAITAALVSVGYAAVPVTAGGFGLGDAARRALMRACRTLDGSRSLIIALAENQIPPPPLVLHVLDGQITPEDQIELTKLCLGLDALAGRYGSVRSDRV
jgi:hypothetical protein